MTTVPADISLRAGWLVAPVAAAGIGAAIAVRPLLAVIAVAVFVAGMAISLTGLSVTAAGVGFVVFGHLVSGQLYVIGVLPEAFAVLLDAVTAVLFISVALRPNPRAPRSHVATMVFLVFGIIAALNPLLPSISYGVFGLRQLILPLVALMIVKEADFSQKDVRFILGVLAAGWAVNVAVALRQWLFDFSGPEITWIEAQDATYLVGDQIRLMGATQSNQDFAFLAAIAVPSIAAFFFAARDRALRIALGILLLASFAVLFGSLIRTTLVGGVIGALVAAGAITAASEQRGRLFGYGIAIVGTLVALSLVAPGTILPENKADTLNTRVTSIFNPGADPSFRERGTEVWPRVLDIVSSHPLGGGPGSAGPLSQARAGEAPFGPVVPDNGYLLMAVQLGVLGLLVFVVMLGTWLRDLVAWARAGLPAAAAGAGALVAVMVGMIAGSYWSLVNPSVIFGVIVGLGLRGDGRRGEIADLVGAPDEPELPEPPWSAPASVPEQPRVPDSPRPAMPPVPAPTGDARRLLVVAAPMVSRGGVYSYLEKVLPAIQERGWQVGLLWACRVPAAPLTAHWTRMLEESESTRERQSQLRGAVRSAVDTWRPDVVVSMLPQSDVACSAVCGPLGVPWVAMLHGSPYPRAAEMRLARRATWRATVGLAYRRADGMLAVSGALARDVRSGLGLRVPITDVGSGIEMPPDAPRRANKEPEITFLGRLSHEKAPDIFVDIAALLGCRAKVFGDGPLAPAVAAAAAQNPQFEYVGWTDRDEALLGTDVLVVPSRREAMPLVVMEGGARRVCVVARDTGGVREVLGRDPELERRCLVPAQATAVDFAGVIRPLLQDSGLRAELGNRLHHVVATHFTLQAHVDRLLEALVSVPGAHRRL